MNTENMSEKTKAMYEEIVAISEATATSEETSSRVPTRRRRKRGSILDMTMDIGEKVMDKVYDRLSSHL